MCPIWEIHIQGNSSLYLVRSHRLQRFEHQNLRTIDWKGDAQFVYNVRIQIGTESQFELSQQDSGQVEEHAVRRLMYLIIYLLFTFPS